jgi:hypothetical protein
MVEEDELFPDEDLEESLLEYGVVPHPVKTKVPSVKAETTSVPNFRSIGNLLINEVSGPWGEGSPPRSRIRYQISMKN